MSLGLVRRRGTIHSLPGAPAASATPAGPTTSSPRAESTKIMPTIRILNCDLDGVIRHFDPHAQARVDTTYGLARGTIARIAFSPAHLIPAVTGLVSDEEWRSGITSDLGRIIGKSDAREAVAAWSADIGTVDACVLDLLRHVRERCPVILFTNATSRLRQDLSSLGLTSEVDAVVNSAETGAPKPHREAFVAADEAIERLLGYHPHPHEILFVDDNSANVDAGAHYGWMTRLFLGAADFAQLLHSVGLLDGGSGLSRSG